MACEQEIDNLAAKVDSWVATKAASDAIRAQRDQMDSEAMAEMYQAYWSLYQCQYGGMLKPAGESSKKESPLPRSISECSVKQMADFLRHVKIMAKNRNE